MEFKYNLKVNSDLGGNYTIKNKCTQLSTKDGKPISCGVLTLNTCFLQELPPIANGCIKLVGDNNRIRKVLDLPSSLQEIYLSRNYIQYYNYDSFGSNLKIFSAPHNFLNDFPFCPPSVKQLIISDNPIGYLPLLPNGIEIVRASKCNLTELPPFPPSLKEFSIKNNNVGVVPNSIMNCRYLTDFKYEGNPNIFISEEILEFIDQQFANRETINLNADDNYVAPVKTVYNDGQNVHMKGVTEAVIKAVNHMKKTPVTIKSEQEVVSDLSNSLKNWKLLEYICGTNGVHTVLEISFKELLLIWYNHIHEKEYKNEVLKILDLELPKMRFICFSGRIGQLVSTLCGFDEDINIGISETDQIQAKYQRVKKMVKPLQIHEPLYQLAFIVKFRELMEEIDVKEEVILIWIDPLIEELAEALQDLITKDDETVQKELYNLPIALRKEMYRYVNPEDYGFSGVLPESDVEKTIKTNIKSV